MSVGGLTTGTRTRPPWLERVGGYELRVLRSTAEGRLLVSSVAVIAILTVAGLVALWPYGWEPARMTGATGTVGAIASSVTDEPCSRGGAEICRRVVAQVEGREVRVGMGLASTAPSVQPGDAIRLIRPGSPDVAPPVGQPVHYDFGDVDRRRSLLWIAVAVAAVAAAVLRWRGVLAVAGVGLSLAVVLLFLVPAILAGKPPLLVALTSALTVMFITLVLTNGIGAQTLAATLGVASTLVLTCVLATVGIRYAGLDGTTESVLRGLGGREGSLSLPAVTLAAMLVGALGVLADTAVTQASAVMALRRANPRLGARQLYVEAFTIGRDHLSATIHTLVLAYAGATLPLLLVLGYGSTTAFDAMNREEIAEPIVATAVGCLALIAAVPLTTGLASVLVGRLPPDSIPEAQHHHH